MSPEQYEIRFWYRQLLEHCLFIYLGLTSMSFIKSDPNFRKVLVSPLPENQPQANLYKLDDLIRDGAKINELKNESRVLLNEWSKYEEKVTKDDYDIPKLELLLNRTGALKTNVLNLEKAGIWSGWLYPGFIQHMLDELNFFYNKLKGNVSIEDEITFWNKINAEHVDLTSHLVNIGVGENRQVVNDGFIISNNGYLLDSYSPDLINAYEYALESLGYMTYVRNSKISSIINPILAEHDIRETERAIEFLRSINR